MGCPSDRQKTGKAGWPSLRDGPHPHSASSLCKEARALQASGIVFGYFSPDVWLPVTSIVATVIGVILMIGRGTWSFLARGWRRARLPRKQFRVMKGSQFQSVRAIHPDPLGR
jgi:hypothetical protein